MMLPQWSLRNPKKSQLVELHLLMPVEQDIVLHLLFTSHSEEVHCKPLIFHFFFSQNNSVGQIQWQQNKNNRIRWITERYSMSPLKAKALTGFIVPACLSKYSVTNHHWKHKHFIDRSWWEDKTKLLKFLSLYSVSLKSKAFDE